PRSGAAGGQKHQRGNDGSHAGWAAERGDHRPPSEAPARAKATDGRFKSLHVSGAARRCRLRARRILPRWAGLNKIGKDTVTQQMIADGAGVHLSTVSLALRNDARL